MRPPTLGRCGLPIRSSRRAPPLRARPHRATRWRFPWPPGKTGCSRSPDRRPRRGRGALRQPPAGPEGTPAGPRPANKRATTTSPREVWASHPNSNGKSASRKGVNLNLTSLLNRQRSPRARSLRPDGGICRWNQRRGGEQVPQFAASGIHSFHSRIFGDGSTASASQSVADDRAADHVSTQWRTTKGRTPLQNTLLNQ